MYTTCILHGNDKRLRGCHSQGIPAAFIVGKDGNIAWQVVALAPSPALSCPATPSPCRHAGICYACMCIQSADSPQASAPRMRSTTGLSAVTFLTFLAQS